MSEFLSKWQAIYLKRDYCKDIATNPGLHDASREVTKVLSDLKIFSQIDSVFEIGCNNGRNLTYLLEKKPSLQPYGNDLFEEKCRLYMDDKLKAKIKFLQIDTKALMLSDFGEKNKIDLFMSCDHMMHLDTDTVATICDRVSKAWKPKYILIREVSGTTKDRTPDSRMPRLGHTYDFGANYELIYDEKSKTGVKASWSPRRVLRDLMNGTFFYRFSIYYFIRVYRRKN